MALENTIEDIVRGSVSFTHGVKNNWNTVYCAVCGDGSRTKGPRGGWLFQNEMCFYHCFNCGCDANFDPNRDIEYSKHMGKVFNAFNVPRDLISAIVFQKRLTRGKAIKPAERRIIINAINIPDHFYKLADADVDNLVAINARQYLKSRMIDPNSYPFYLSTAMSYSDNPKDIAMAKAMRNRLIVPSFRGEDMVYYFARALDPESKLAYINANVPRTNIIYGFDKLYITPKNPLFVCEGFFDAHHMNGVAVLENHMTKDQIEILERSPRPKVIVPDKGGDSRRLAEQGVGLGWGITLPDIGACKDVNAGIQKYGKLYVLDSLMKNILTGRAAQGALLNPAYFPKLKDK